MRGQYLPGLGVIVKVWIGHQLHPHPLQVLKVGQNPVIAQQLACLYRVLTIDQSEDRVQVTWSKWPIRGQYLPVPQAPLGPKNSRLMIFHRFWTNTWLLFCWVKTLLYLIDSSLSFSLNASMYWEVNWSLLSPISRFRLCCETYRETFFWKLVLDKKYGIN